ARAHAHNVQVHIWTINDPDAMQHYLNLGVDGLITDYPDRLLRILNRQPAEETSWATP
ncbi:MAG: glycerophosphodiester phosphodiesterase family protein, partial [Gemmatimonadota bacterium]|nr:glycerophosphodiester phosphodiesterase family protein [Gemmatimonadota bacterium]